MPVGLGPALPPTEHLPSERSAVLTGHEGPVLAVRFNTTGTYCLTCGKDRALKLWNPHKGTCVKTYNGHGYDVRDVAVSSDNSKIASCGGDRQLFLWDVGTGRIIRKFKGHDGAINAVAYAASDQVLATAGYDQAVCMWDCRSNNFNAMQTMKVFADSVTSVACTARSVTAGSVDGSIRCFDIRAGTCFTDEMGHPVASIALSHDGNCVLAACLDSHVRLLDRESGELLATYQGHKHESAKMDCAFTVSDAYTIGSSEDGRVLYWDLVEEHLALAFSAHQGTVCSLAMHPGGDCLLTAGTDGSVHVWR